MQNSAAIALISTVQERCRTCYMCVRECPAKAIRISSGRAEVLAERCIGCGNCVQVCTQRAKRVYDSIPEVTRLLASGAPVAAILASSFPAELTCAPTDTIVGMVRALGFTFVHEASFGGDLVAERYRQLLAEEDMLVPSDSPKVEVGTSPASEDSGTPFKGGKVRCASSGIAAKIGGIGDKETSRPDTDPPTCADSPDSSPPSKGVPASSPAGDVAQHQPPKHNGTTSDVQNAAASFPPSKGVPASSPAGDVAQHQPPKHNGKRRYISANCPAIVRYIQRYYPELTPSLAPIVSPMVAMARALKAIHGEDLHIVFIGPCIAKKGEIRSPRLRGEIDGALTFMELRRMLRDRGITAENTTATPLDPPYGRAGGLYPISRGLLQAANITEDLSRGEVVAADGRSQFPEAVEEFEAERLDVRLLEVLACRGCINGPGMSYGTSIFTRQMAVSRHVRKRMDEIDEAQWRETMDRFATLDLSRSYDPDDQRWPVPSEEEVRALLKQIGKHKPENELNCGACGYDTCRELAIATFKGMAESAMCLPWTIEQLRQTMRALAVSNDQLDETREALLQTERIATMGQLAAGVAHELNNPLGIILMYAHLIREEYGCGGEQLKEDLGIVTEQADRCKKIVSGLLDFARQNKVECEETDVVQLIDRALAAVSTPEGVTVERQHHSEQTIALIDRDQMLQVLINLIGNAYAAMPNGGTLAIATAVDETRFELNVSDTGTGIPEADRAKVFEPFFTTREAGQGTGLGLAVSYGIVKMHRGDIAVTSNTDPSAGPTGTTFTIVLPQTAGCS